MGEAAARRGLLLAAVLAAAAAGACAEPFAASVGVASATVLRGVALGAGALDVHASASWSHPRGWRVAAGAAALHTKSSPGRWEPQLYARGAYAAPIDDDWSAQAGIARYAYPGSELADAYGRDEAGATLAFRDLAYLSLTALRYRPRYPGRSRDAAAADLVVRWPLAAPFAAVAGLGRREARGAGLAYGYGHVGVAAASGETHAQLVWIASGSAARDRFGDAAGKRWVASLARNF